MSMFNMRDKTNQKKQSDSFSILMLKRSRYFLFLTADLFFSALSIFLSLYFRFGISIPMEYLAHLPLYIIVSWFTTSGVLLLMRFYFVDRTLFNITSFLNISISLFVGYICFGLVNLIIYEPLPWGVVFNYCIIIFVFMIAYRLLLMFAISFLGGIRWNARYNESCNRVLIIGAGEVGKFLLNKLRYDRDDHRRVIGFIDDNIELWGRNINGVKVLGGCSNLIEIISNFDIGSVIVAAPHVKHSVLRSIVEQCESADCNVRQFAGMNVVDEYSLKKATLREISLQELLGRDEASLDMLPVQNLLRGKTVLVTGGAGSIGSEVCRQVLLFGAKKVIILDFNENGLFEIGGELDKNYDKSKFETVLGNIRETQRLEEVFQKYKPQIVFHAAAHKHVPMMEINPYEALVNNVIGTYQVAQSAINHNTERFILISTDKAVNPTNVMGASKRIAELLIQHLNVKSPTIFSAVRFGNVMGSNGSVIPVFKKQIENGGPVTVTDRNIKRYFMTIPEAVQLVLQAGTMAKGAEIFVLDMGEPVYIYDLACTMIRLAGFEPETDIAIKFVGLRDGEKLFEELHLDSESVSKTDNNQIFILKSAVMDEKMFEEILINLREMVTNRDGENLASQIAKLIPGFIGVSILL